ncbi:capsular polysaccharide biosynthesis protein [Psychromonas ingrahamii 37]|uniref:Capsular polysaccharide biosynthesis protein n=1 Tax=Psychromonas ingrahamii (strain DSM 17664 / CCUG 51855 / 37) TaxID=357804 RepID=A1SS35_PSYIN|nr:phenylacetate--CoA ligase family protein [Psychromonas ingrahamii]ABM02300.1 capsular polysaccharide biosynthesis protein [Psychromonas ingrahamii 37]
MKKSFSKKNVWEAMPAVLKNISGMVLSYIPLEYLIGRKFREMRKEILNADHWTKKQVDAYQLQQLKKQLKSGYENCPAYRKLYDQAKIDINSINTLDDFRKLPLVDKAFINENRHDLLLVDKDSPGVDYVTTGGTSGVPLAFYINASRSQIEYAYLVDGWRKAGFKLGNTKAVLRGRVTGLKKGVHQSYDPIFKEYYYSNFHMSNDDMRSYITHIKTLKNCFLHVYPSSIYQLARFIKKENIKVDNIKAILAESENVYPEQRAFVESVFNCRYYSSYGHSEKLVAAGECEHSTDYHVWPTYGFLELLDERGRVITERGQIGEIVGTGFINTVMPFIRYKTGDYAEYVGDLCEACQRHHLIIKNIRGHNIQEHLVAFDHSLIPWSAINMHDDTFDDVLQYQFYQDTAGVAVIKIKTAEGFTAEKKQRIISNISRKLDHRIAVSVTQVDDIRLTERGKSVFVDQRINISN